MTKNHPLQNEWSVFSKDAITLSTSAVPQQNDNTSFT